MKRVLTLTLALAMVLSLFAGCNSKEAAVPTRGAWEGQTWKNEYAQLTFTLPEEWEISTDEAAASTMGIDAGIMGEQGAEYTAEMLEAGTINDMMASSPISGASVMFGVESLTANSALGKFVSEKQYLENVQSMMEESDMYTIGEQGSEKIGENTYTTLALEFSQNGVTGEQKYMVRKIDSYIVFIVATTMFEESADDVIANFS